MADHRANVEDMDGVNTAKLFEAMEVEFEDMEHMWEGCVKDVLRVLGNQRKRDINGMRISPVQFLRDRELGIRGEKHGKVITKHVLNWSLLARQRVYTWLREEAKDVYKNINVDVVKNEYYWAKIIADRIPYRCKCIKIPAGSDKCVELLIIEWFLDVFPPCEIPSKKLLLDLCNDRQCFDCKQCIFAFKHNDKVRECYDIIESLRYYNACFRETCKCSVEECDVI
ncbi:hypothetical protein ALC57_00183 [Trachymyrmex cornetzi]|uniref:Uncharacterized protein n=1 Tax=Trachymyrmex cornetzi TaxID=471704 RepID=A0A151JSK0_9HYME|nr:hypothetical protein ALC57_00183 [Trachymyrmex cornetzi]